MTPNNRFKYTLRILFGVFLGLYIGMSLFLNIPYVQKKTGVLISQELKKVLNTEVTIGHIDIGFFNRIIAEDILLKDLRGNDMLKIARLSAKFDILPLFEKKLRISNVQLFGFNINFNKETPNSAPNYQFLVDALASKDTTKSSTYLDLRINTLLIRRGRINYDVWSEPCTPNQFQPSHLCINDLTATVSLKALNRDTINIAVRRFSFKEHQGFELKNLKLSAVANNHCLNVNDFMIELPHSTLKFNNMSMQFDSLPSVIRFTDDMIYQGNVNGILKASDVSWFLPVLQTFSHPMELSLQYTGKGTHFECPVLLLTDNKHFTVSTKASVSHWNTPKSMSLSGDVSLFHVSHEGIRYLTNNLMGKTPPILERMKFLEFTGHIGGKLNDLNFNGILHTDAGTIASDIVMKQDNQHKRSYSGTLASHDLNLGILLANEKKIGKTDFNIELQGFHYRDLYPETVIKGVISSLEYSNYRYENIKMDGLYKEGGFDGHLSLNDENCQLQIDGSFNIMQQLPHINVSASLKGIRPNELNLSEKFEGSDISLQMKANFTGKSADELNGIIRFDSLIMNTHNAQSYFMENMTILAQNIGDEKALSIQSPFMNALIQGHYKFKTLPQSILHALHQYLPSSISISDPSDRPNNQLKFDIRIENTELFEKIFHLPVQMHMPSTLTGFLHDDDGTLKVIGYFPQLTYDGTLYESAHLLCETPANQFNFKLRGSTLMKSGAMLNLSLDAQAKEDRLLTQLNWGNNTNVTYGGKLEAITHFFKNDATSPSTYADIEIMPTSMVLNDTLWHIYPSHIAIDSGRVDINNFQIGRNGQHLRIDGKISDTEQDSCLIELENVNVKYVLDILRFDDVDFGGMATGLINLKSTLKDPMIQTRLKVAGFSMNQALLGNADISGHWDKELGGIRLDARIKEEGISATHVTGYVSPQQKGLDLMIEADSMNLGIITPYVKDIFSDINARIKGNVRLYGPFKYLDFEGDVKANFDAKINVLNTYFQIKDDSIHIKSGEIAFDNLTIYDREGNHGILNGYLRHNKLKNMTYNFDVNANNLLVYDSDDMGDMSLYGRIYAIGDIQVHGGNNTMNIDVALTTGANTTFTYVSGITTSATSNQFITFVDKTPKRMQDLVETDFYHHSDAQKKQEDDGPPMDLYINMMVEATPEAQMKVIMDPVSGDHITARGNGNLQVSYYNKGDFRIFGNYIIEQGVYKLSMQEVIRKDFVLQQGGIVSFSGDPFLANLDLQAVYTVNSASLSDLSTDATLNQSTVKVNCIMNLTGSLANPNISFDLDLPAVSEEDRELVRSATSTEEQMNTQIIYLLTIGKFYTYDYANNNNQSNATSSLAFSTLSGQLNNMLSQWTENKNWNIGANLSTGQAGWSNVEAEAILSGRLLNNRLLLNGNFGYRENVMANTNFVGDFEAIWLLTKNGDLRLRGYNQTNDRYFTKSTLTTQGVGLIYKKDFDNWNDLFLWLFKNRNKPKNDKKDKE